jgi:hypothetical protein
MRLAVFVVLCLAMTACGGRILPGVPYVVQPGDTLTTIATLHGVSKSVIVEANDLRSNILEPGRILQIPGGRADTTAPPAPATPKAEEPPAGPQADAAWYRPRAAWATAAIRESLAKPMATPFRITVHHSGRSDDAEEAATLRLPKIERVHQAQLWACIGYHFIVDAQGTVWEGRPLRYQGAHAHGDANNRGNIGVCLLGDFETSRVPPAQAKALRGLLERLCADYRIDRAQTYVHRELWDGTECPGRFLKQVVLQWRSGAGPGPALRATQALDR